MQPSIELLDVTSIAGDAKDTLTVKPETLEDGTPQARVGGIGSGIDYTGTGVRYIAVPDRPGSQLSYALRFYLLDWSPRAKSHAQIRLSSAQTLRDEAGRGLVGKAEPGAGGATRFDPESVRVSGRGTFFVSDEYGPSIAEFDASGRRLRELQVPEKFRPQPGRGRQPKSGFEGLAISPDGQHLFALVQRPLLQDHGLDARGEPHGIHCRLLDLELATGKSRELVYGLENRRHGVNELLAVNDHELLVLERDWEGDVQRAYRRVLVVDLRDATDVSDLASLPAKRLPAGVRAVSKRALLDLRASPLGLQHDACTAKVESLAFAPDLDDGRHVLLVGCDNDFRPDVPSEFAAFALKRSLLDYQPLVLGLPLQVRTRELQLLSSPLLDATAVVRDSIVVSSGRRRVPLTTEGWAERDVDGDGTPDLVHPLEPQELSGDEARLVAVTRSGHPVKSRAALRERAGL